MDRNDVHIGVLEEKVSVLSRNHSELRERFDNLEDVVISHSTMINEHKIATAKINEMHSILTSARGISSFASGFVKFMLPIVMFVIAVIVYFRTGVWDYKP